MKRSIFAKVFLGYLFIALILSGLILFVSFNKIRSYHITSLSKDLAAIAYAVQPSIKPLIVRNKINELDKLTKEIGTRIHARLTVIDPSGKVLADSQEDPSSMENHGFRPEIKQALASSMGVALRFSATVGEKMLYVAVPLDDVQRRMGVIRVSIFLRDINHFINRLMVTIISITMLIVVVSLMFALLFSRGLVRPVRLLGVVARKVAGGDFAARVQLESHDEFRDLSDNFNYMAQQVQSLFSQLSDQKTELNTIISSLSEGLVVIDKDEKIVLCNESFSKIAGNSVTEGDFYWEVIRESHFVELVKKALSNRINLAGEVAVNDIVYLCNTSYLAAKKELVVIFHDITELRKLEKIKKDFASNISHELRTPLSAIKGYVETMEDTIDEKNRHYVDIIKRHAERLSHIVEDLLTLSELEEIGITMREKVQIKDIIDNVAHLFGSQLDERKLSCEIQIENDIPMITVDPFKIEQVFVNLIDNAIKYTEEGGIIIALSHQKDKVVVRVKDTGIGIPKEYLGRIFERFYIVDKSRSRKFGGTGLGLSIVKHIVLLHNGSIEVESVPDKGTTFTVILPVQ